MIIYICNYRNILANFANFGDPDGRALRQNIANIHIHLGQAVLGG